MTNVKRSGQDSGWKMAIEIYLKDFLKFFFPLIFDEVDIDRGYEFLDKELEKVVRDAEIGKRFADKLIQVYLNDGSEKWLLIHLEVQGYSDDKFEKRMFTYYYRIFDRYDREVISLAILTDGNQTNRPCRYEIGRWGFKLLFEFPIVKIIDYKDRIEELKISRNPFAVIVLAHLNFLETKGDDEARRKCKKELIESLYDKYSKEDIMNLYLFIDWLLVLPDEFEHKLQGELRAFEEERKVAYISSAERIGRQEGLQEGLLDAISLGLELKFGDAGLRLFDRINLIKDIQKLREIKNAIIPAKSLADIERLI